MTLQSCKGSPAFTIVNTYNPESLTIDDYIMRSQLQGLKILLNLFHLLNCHKEVCQADGIPSNQHDLANSQTHRLLFLPSNRALVGVLDQVSHLNHL